METTSTATEAPKRQRLNRQRGGYSAELANWLQNNASLMGERSNFGGLVASIERGGSGGCRGTKGVGVVRIEPFESWAKLKELHGAFDRAAKCEQAWRALTTYERWLLCARYLFSRDKLPAGMLGQLGDLSVVAYVVADRLGIASRLALDASKQRTRQWESVCAIALDEAHRSWQLARADVDREEAAESMAEPAQ
jgi:hypothetical protein